MQVSDAGSANQIDKNGPPLTRPFRDMVLGRLKRDPKFRDRLHQETLDCIQVSDVATGRSMLREYFNEDVPHLATLDSSGPAV